MLAEVEVREADEEALKSYYAYVRGRTWRSFVHLDVLLVAAATDGNVPAWSEWKQVGGGKTGLVAAF